MAATLCDNIQEYVVPPGVTAVRIATWCHRGDPLPVIRSLAPLIRCSARPARRWTERPPKVRAYRKRNARIFRPGGSNRGGTAC